jgi:hypothetical protein
VLPKKAEIVSNANEKMVDMLRKGFEQTGEENAELKKYI